MLVRGEVTGVRTGRGSGLLDSGIEIKWKIKVQLQELVRRFCSAKELMFVTEGNFWNNSIFKYYRKILKLFSLGDAREIVNSGLIEIVKIPLKGKATSGEYNCLICPLTQGHHRGFKRKEDMKRHNQLHFKVFYQYNNMKNAIHRLRISWGYM